MYSGLVCCLWSDQYEFMAHIWFVISGLDQVLFFSLVFHFSVSIFLLLPLYLICSQVRIISYCVCGARWLRIAQSKKYIRLGPSWLCTEMNWLPKHLASLKNYMMQKVPKNIVSVNFSHTVFSLFFFFSPHLKMGPIGCPEMSVRNHHGTLCNIPEERRSHIMIWQ